MARHVNRTSSWRANEYTELIHKRTFPSDQHAQWEQVQFFSFQKLKSTSSNPAENVNGVYKCPFHAFK